MGKTIVITGAGSGLGRAMARALAGCGHRPVLLGRTQAAIAAVADELGGGALAIACDVADPASVDAAFVEIAARVSTIDALVNNAGTYEPLMLAEASDAQIAVALGTNLAGPIHCVRAARPLMGRGGHVINIGSETVIEPAAMLGLYQATKAALERYTRTLRQELVPAGIRVTLIRAGKMVDADTKWNVDPAVTARFVEESLRIGVDNRKAAISHFDSVARLVPTLLDLPEDLNVAEIMLEARHT